MKSHINTEKLGRLRLSQESPLDRYRRRARLRDQSQPVDLTVGEAYTHMGKQLQFPWWKKMAER